MTDEELLLACAMEFKVLHGDQVVYITRYDNHRRPLAGNKWCICSWRSGGPWMDSTNSWYLGNEGIWRYKYGVAFETAQDALTALRTSCLPGTNGWYGDAENSREATPLEEVGMIR